MGVKGGGRECSSGFNVRGWAFYVLVLAFYVFIVSRLGIAGRSDVKYNK